MLKISEIHTEGEELDAFRSLVREHQTYVGQGFNPKGLEAELVDPFSRYIPSRGVIVVGYWNDQSCAIGALQDHGHNVCELKRIYVSPDFRRKGIARSISEYLIARAHEIGYEKIWLDTLRRLPGAAQLYQSLGFVEIRSSYEGPGRDLVVMEIKLTNKENQ